ncbi:hypothetical protein N9J72_03090 [Candidatus Gracilibacteria bacterium]|nr:hypothetical protein [Candidatus Gracilibacteria bacterium]
MVEIISPCKNYVPISGEDNINNCGVSASAMNLMNELRDRKQKRDSVAGQISGGDAFAGVATEIITSIAKDSENK